MNIKIIILSFFMIIEGSCNATPAAVFIVRHGEKQLALNENNQPQRSKKGKFLYTRFLSDRGWQRACAISYDLHFFDNKKYGKPVAVFGAAPIDKEGSLRPIETITPLANRLKLKVIKKYCATQHHEIANFILNNKKFQNKLVIIAWEHHNIPLLAQAFGAKQAPDIWHGHIFDRIWEIEFNVETGQVVSFINKPQKLLYQDSSI